LALNVISSSLATVSRAVARAVSMDLTFVAINSAAVGSRPRMLT